MAAESEPQHLGVVVIGAGFGGLAAAHSLKGDGEDFAVLEREQEVGGVWRDNSYPGCACDIPSHLYSLSFAPNPHWTHAFSQQSEIRDYLRQVACEHGLLPHIRFGCSLLGAAWDDTAQRWRIETSAGPLTADVLIDGSGPIAEPSLPDLPGLDGFAGEVFHSARWNHDLNLTGRKVVVIGTGASAIQFVPAIQPIVGRMTVVQRTAPWVTPRMDRATTRLERRLYAAAPWLQRLIRGRQYWMRELVTWKVMVSPRVRRIATKAALWHMRRQVADPALRERLTPNWELGCKRILISNDWYPALSAPNVEVVSAGVREVRAHSVVTTDGREHPADVIIFGTGFHVADPPLADHLRGRDGRTLAECWNGSPHTYLGVTVTNFPNLFRLGGAGSATGHNSHVFQEECQVAYAMDALHLMRARGITSVEVRAEEQRAYVEQHTARLAGTVWSVGGCNSFYQGADGVASLNWPDATWKYRRATRRFDPAPYELRTTAAVAPTAN
ncbi:NAD(P)/FAD-dependent oxidoreductase [Streptomyces mirabilis]|uniref:flavin-containing monooxygenase n=1 Tax=Streptomyces mirabilis TaxID=68239 RepID=UPI001BAF9343|nr:NAD(P)/FAD-dependent oxidoreductase [Streptomyces mirabilis]QUW83974.1 NAD(P)/FAD-dependent oxidoreductase [Streptomyces mirabilis]